VTTEPAGTRARADADRSPVKAVLVTDARSRAAALQLRMDVFVVEQAVSADIEIDGKDDDAEHAVIFDPAGGGSVLATARLLTVQGIGIVGRVAVRKDHRGTGLGAVIMTAIENRARELGLPVLELHAQRAAEGFYARIGYQAYGDTYLEAGIPHVSMRKVLTPA
jgi:predicted GNAT family N-acyltransferase